MELYRHLIHSATQIIYIFFIFAGLLLVSYTGRRLCNKVFDRIVSAVVVVTAMFYVFMHNTGSTFVLYFALAFTMTSVIYILNFIKFTILEYSLLFTMFFIFKQMAEMNQDFFGITFYLCILFTAICGISKINLKSINGNIFNIWLTFVLTAMDQYLFEHIFDSFRRHIGYSFRLPQTKVVVWLVATILAICINIMLVMLIKKLFNSYFSQINLMGKRYPSIERHFLYVSIGILFFVTIVHCIYVIRKGFSPDISGMLSFVCMAGLVLQLVYLTLLFRVAHLKDNLSYKEQENQNLILYSSKLEETYNDFKHIKHDIKNIFFTMGRFVERNNDEEMKEFYQSKIFPFATDEIKKGDLSEKLMFIKNEPLKAFLYYKITQAMEREINVALDIVVDTDTYIIAIDFTDLIRVLGILLDNAIEECLSIEDGFIEIKIFQNNDTASYTIKNSITTERQVYGIKPGISTKGENRGLGLTIVQNILDMYDFVALNSYFHDNFFVQNLNIYLFSD